jgi:hypothetical protein
MQVEGIVRGIGELSEKSNGTYKSIDFVIETEEQYPQKFVINIFSKGHDQHGFKAERFNDEVSVGQKLTVEFNGKATEYNGRHYNNLLLWNYKKLGNAPVAQSAPATAAPVSAVVESEETDVPF